MDRAIVQTFDHMRNLSDSKLITMCINGTAYRTNCFVYLYERLERDRVMLTVIRPPQFYPCVRVNISLRLYGCGDSNPECTRIHALCSELHGLQGALEVFANERDVTISDICTKTNVLYSSILVDYIHTYATHFEKHAVHSWPYSTAGNC
jgi:hypothetical protein